MPLKWCPKYWLKKAKTAKMRSRNSRYHYWMTDFPRRRGIFIRRLATPSLLLLSTSSFHCFMTYASRRIRIFLKGVSTKFIMAQDNHADWLVQRNRDQHRELSVSNYYPFSQFGWLLRVCGEEIPTPFNSHSKQFRPGYWDVPGKNVDSSRITNVPQYEEDCRIFLV